MQTPRPIPSVNCSPDGYLIQKTTLYAVSLTDGTLTQQEVIGTANDNPINAIGYNVLDDFLYGITTSNPRNLIRFNPQGQFQLFASAAFAFNTGDIDDNGQMWVRSGANWAQFNLNPSLPGYLIQVASGSDAVTALAGILDWAFVPGGGSYLYAPGVNTTTGETYLTRWSTVTKQFETILNYGPGPLAQTGRSSTAVQFGAAYATRDGRLFVGENFGNVFEFPLNSTAWKVVAKSPSTSSNDGARCVKV